MQIKKEEVKNAIIKSATKEFLENGFEKASLRKIVKNAGTTTGNFYNYFLNKEALFDEIVSDDYNMFIYFIKNHDRIERPDYLWDIPNPTIWKNVLLEMMKKFIPNFGIGVVLILDASKGTKYENAKTDLIDLLEEHFNEHLDKLDNNSISRDFGKIVAIQVIEGMILILKDNKSLEEKQELISELILFYMVGTMGIMGSF